MPVSKTIKLIALSVALTGAIVPAARADEASVIIWQQTPTVMQPGSTTVERSTAVEQTPDAVVVPAPSVTTEEVTITNEVPKTIISPVIVTPPAGAVMQQSVQVEQTTPLTVTTTETVIERGPLPEFRKRLSLLQEQIDLGLSRGWLTASQASMFKQRADSLMSMAQVMSAQDFDQARSDSLERQTNALNIDLSDAMKGTPAIATPPGVLK